MKAPRAKTIVKASADPIGEVFGSSGIFAREFPGYQPRSSQIDVARDVASTIEKRRVLLCEAPTGTGKSLAYLVPAIQSVARDGGKLVVATANIALQEQLVRKDLPMLQRVLGVPFTFALAKGFSNYVCQDARDAADTESVMGRRLPVLQEQKMLEEAIAWSRTSETGDLSDFEYELPFAVKKLMTIPSDECLGKKCSHYGPTGDCHPRMARRAFGAADVIVVNYHLYFLDMEMKRRGARGVLPEHRILICDEGHNMAEIARSFLGERVSSGSVKAAAEDLDAKGRRAERLELPRELAVDLKARLEGEAQEYFADAFRLRRDKNRYKARLNRKNMVDGAALEGLLRQAAQTYEKAAFSPSLDSDAREWLRGRSNLCLRQAGVVKGARELSDREQIFYIDDNNGRAAIVREPVSPAKILRECLWEPEYTVPAEAGVDDYAEEDDSRTSKREKPYVPPNAIVVCSATLSAGGRHGFEYAAKEIGVLEYDTIEVDSPFDYSRSAFIVPRGLPDTSEREFADVVGETLIETVTAAGGRTLGLFTSWKMLDAAYERITAARLPYAILKQGDMPRSLLIKKFKEDPTSVLLGTESFWEGVDVPGDALLAVLIDKLPFDHFEDPVLDAIKERDKQWFNEYYLPKAVIKFKQGIGRLIRSVTDYGAVVCCDHRVTSKPYGAKFKRAVPSDAAFSDRLSTVTEVCKRYGSAAA